MKIMSIDANAKINFAIDVKGKRLDGYHEVSMIMQSVELHDVVTVEIAETGNIEVICDDPAIPSGKNNIAYKACETMCKDFNIQYGFKITIQKNIPQAAGLGGGSSDAAAVIKAVNSLCNLNLNDATLLNTAVKIGADVPFCLTGGTALAEGIGEKLTFLKPIVPLYLVLVNPGFNVSTKYVYDKIDTVYKARKPFVGKLVELYMENKIEDFSKNLKNVLELVTIKEYPIIMEIKNKLLSLGSLGSLMSGSGPTVFGIFTEEKQAIESSKEIKHWNNNLNVWVTKTCW